MKQVNSFSDAFPKQSQNLDRVMETAGTASILEDRDLRGRVSNVAQSVLRNDIDWQLSNGKLISLTKRVKENLHLQAAIITKGGRHPVLHGGKCLVCGRDFKAGEIVIMQNDGSSETVCLECADPKTKISMDGEAIIAVCD